MKTAIKLAVATLVLTMAASAADRTKGAFLENATTGYYEFYGPYSYVYIDATTYKVPSGGMRGYLVVYLYDWANNRYLVAYGSVPLSMFRVGQQSFTINVSDLRDSMSNGYFDASGFPDPVVVNCTMTAISLWTGTSIRSYTERTPQPDGTTTLTKYMEKYTQTSVDPRGEVAGYTLPLNEPYGYDAFIQRGNYKSHFVH